MTKQKQSKGVLSYLHNFIVQRDVYGEPISFEVDGDSDKKSVLGAIVSILIMACVAMYGFNKYTIM